MELSFWKVCGLVLLTVILGLNIGKTEKDFALLLSLMGCCIAAAAAATYLEPVIELLWDMNRMGSLQDGVMKILLHCIGIALAAELGCMICSDAGNGALGKALQFLGSAAIFSLSVPIFQNVLMLIQEILGEL